MQEVFFGFQLRVNPCLMETWSTSHADEFLLKPVTLGPLSADVAVWPSSGDKDMRRRLFCNAYDSPDQEPNGLSVYRLREKVFPSDLLSKPNSPVLLALSTTADAFARLAETRNIYPVDVPVNEQSDWVCAGYDVTDSWLVSGLLNCGYTGAEKVSLTNMFGNTINSSGVFLELLSAQTFCTLCNQRVPEHAPFMPIGLWIPRSQHKNILLFPTA